MYAVTMDFSRDKPTDHAEFLRLLLKHERGLMVYIRAMLPSHGDAADVMQETTVTLWEKFGEFEAGTDFRAWAFRTAYWKVREARQKAARSKLIFDDEVVAAVAGTAERMTGEGDTRHRALAICLDKLNERDRKMVMARYEEDGGIDWAAQSSGRTTQAVYRALGRVKALLRDCVRQQMEHGGSMNETERDLLELERLAHALEEGMITDAEISKLEEMLRRSESLREEYVRLTEISVGLGRYAAEPVVVVPNNRWRNPAAWAFAAAALVMLAGLVVIYPREPAAITALEEIRESGCAVLTRTVDVKWTNTGFETGLPVGAGAMAIAGGLVELEFYSGARVVIEGPAEIELISTSEIRCGSGKLRAVVPTNARGFKVSTRQFGITNQGAEFGLWANHDGRDEVHVIDGRVEIRSHHRDERGFRRQGPRI